MATIPTQEWERSFKIMSDTMTDLKLKKPYPRKDDDENLGVELGEEIEELDVETPDEKALLPDEELDGGDEIEKEEE